MYVCLCIMFSIVIHYLHIHLLFVHLKFTLHLRCYFHILNGNWTRSYNRWSAITKNASEVCGDDVSSWKRSSTALHACMQSQWVKCALDHTAPPPPPPPARHIIIISLKITYISLRSPFFLDKLDWISVIHAANTSTKLHKATTPYFYRVQAPYSLSNHFLVFLRLIPAIYGELHYYHLLYNALLIRHTITQIAVKSHSMANNNKDHAERCGSWVMSITPHIEGYDMISKNALSSEI